jgi:DNA-binding transcriptional LysR family regulator
MEIRQIEIFAALAEELNFTRTAERVHTVQSNVTAQIRALEEELGTPLFDRFPRNVILTEAGRRFLPYAERMLAAMEQGQRAVRFGQEPAGPLRIGTPESVLTYRLSRVLQSFRERYPKVELIFRPELSLSLAESLDPNRFDLAVTIVEKVDQERFHSLRLRTEKILLLAGAEHPLGSHKSVRPQDLGGQALLLTEAGCSYRVPLDRALTALRIRPESITEFSSVEAIKHCMMAGMGIGLLPEIVVAKELKEGKLQALRWLGPEMSMATHILWHKDKWISPAMDAFVKTVKAELQER